MGEADGLTTARPGGGGAEGSGGPRSAAPLPFERCGWGCSVPGRGDRARGAGSGMFSLRGEVLSLAQAANTRDKESLGRKRLDDTGHNYGVYTVLETCQGPLLTRCFF